jgi:hypothetical protein
MTPTKIILEKTDTFIQLRVIAPDTLKGCAIIASTPLRTGNSIPALRKDAAKYAKRFAIPFVDTTTAEV